MSLSLYTVAAVLSIPSDFLFSNAIVVLLNLIAGFISAAMVGANMGLPNS